ncbi:TMF family protein [Zobellia roscoffensis]|uniref:beta strand repeat-containing protein n=1 Tax=Zobellia roscoffensis TaxID=2779508 RepID=UPI00188B9FFC|nr:TMF family protein [Zobellia roscoffensis]
MQKRISIPLFFIGFFLISFAQAQVKIGDNPQVIDPASILELESSDKVLVITRVDSLQMTTIVPNRGALVYNTTADCVYYFDGTAWISMCDGVGGGALTATPIVNSESTIVITPTEGGNNFEIAPNSITSDQILNGGINGVDIQNGSIGRGKLAPNAVDKARIAQNAVGPYAIDRDSLPLSFFNNDAGFITGANVVSGDADNDIEIGSDSGAFFDATTLEDNIAANTTAIAADNDGSPTNEIQNLNLTGNRLSLSGATGFVDLPTADGSDTNITAGNNVSITGNGTTATPYVINSNDEADGSVTNELITGVLLNASNQLVITEAGTNTTVDLSSLAGGTGTADGVISNVVYNAADNNLTFTGTGGGFNGTINLDDLDGGGTGTNQNAAQVPVAATAVNYTAATADVEAHLAGIDAALAGGSTDNQNADEVPVTLTATNYTAATPDVEAHLAGINTALATAAAQNLSEVLATGNTAGNLQIKDVLDPTLDQDAATKAYVDATVAAGGTLTDGSILIGGAGDVAQQLVMSGDALIDNAGVLTIEDNVIESANILDSTIDLADFSDMGADADGQIMRWSETNSEWEIASAASHSGQPKSIFLADENGDPAQAFHPTNGNPSLVWDYEARQVGGNNYGALGIGLDGGTISNDVKVHIAEEVFGGLSYPLMIQNRTGGDGTGSSVAMLFAVERDNYGKGALVYDRQESWARGDFHFLQNTATTTDLPTLADKAFTVKNNKDIVLYNGIEIAGDRGDANQVLTSNGAGAVSWEDAGNLTITDTDANDALVVQADSKGYNIGVDDTTIEIITDALQVKDESIDSDKIKNSSIALVDLSPMGATANGEILKWDQDNLTWTIGTDNGGSTTYTGGAGLTLTGTSFTVDNLQGEVTGPTSATVIADDVIGTDELAIDAVIEENIIANAVTSAKIAPNTIALDDLSPMGATTTGQILKWDQATTQWTIGTDNGGSTTYTGGAGLTLTGTSFAVDNLAGEVTGPTSATIIATNAITADKIATGAVNTDEIAAGAVVTNSIANDNVTPDKISQGTDGQILTTSGTDVVWADAQNFAKSDLTQTLGEKRTYNLNGSNLQFATNGGNIGIGGLPGEPQDQLDVNGSVRSRGGFNATEGTANSPGYGFYTNGDTDTGMFRDSDDNLGFSTGGIEVIRIDDLQNVGIGTATPAEKLHVAGSIQADGDFISNNTTIQVPDYVFQKYFLGNSELKGTYNFTNLEDVEAFIKENHHLPGVTSAVEAMKKGQWNLSASNLQNLEKIEELFLHTIEQEKEIKKLKAEKEAMANELKSMKNDIEEIKALLNQ